ncbi:MAG TPA: POTRA domain-containing protein [Pirellulales bacterium]|nr:POTRA domain-containing protein [Pirellulales bacterium]
MPGVWFDRRALTRAALLIAVSIFAPRPSAAQMVSPDALPGDDGALTLPSKQAKPTTAGEQPRRELPPGVTTSSGLMPAGLDNSGGLPVISSQGVPKPGLTGLTGKEIVVGIRFVGLVTVTEQVARRNVKSMEGRPFNEKTVGDDVRRLTQAGLLGNDVSYQRVGDNGIVITFHVYERPTIRYIKFHGNKKIRRRSLLKQCGLKEKEQFLIESVKDAKNRLEEYYHEKGYNKATVKIIEGDKSNDRGVVFLINEGQKQKVFWVEFEGNKIASDGQLRTKIKSKPPLLYLFKGEVDRQLIDADVAQIIDYYRGLGFFQARVGRELIFNEAQNWVTIRFVIDEGPRSKVRNIEFLGPKIFSREQLMADLNLHEGDYFNGAKREKDRTALEDKYGEKGYVFAVIQPEIRFDEAPGEVDLVYQIEEGKPCVVSRINVAIKGDNPHTRRNTILNRVSLHPGDLLSTKEVRDSERRLRGSSLFKNTPGSEPKISFDRPDVEGIGGIAERPGGAMGAGGFRGQSPDPQSPSPQARRPRHQAPRFTPRTDVPLRSERRPIAPRGIW